MCVTLTESSIRSQQQSPTQEQSSLTLWCEVRKYVMSLAQGSVAFKWAWNMVLRKNRKAVCSAFGIHMYTHASFIQDSLQTAGPWGMFHKDRKNGFGTASRTHTCLLSSVKHETVTFHKTACTHSKSASAHTTQGTHRLLGHFPQMWNLVGSNSLSLQKNKEFLTGTWRSLLNHILCNMWRGIRVGFPALAQFWGLLQLFCGIVSLMHHPAWQTALTWYQNRLKQWLK